MRSMIICVVWLMSICAAFAPSAASAGTISMFTQSFSPENAASDPHVVASLPRFDAALGQLIGVTIELDVGIAGGGLTFDNEGTMGGAVNLGYGGSVKVDLLDLSVSALLPIQYANGVVTADDDGTPDFLGADSFLFVGGTASGSDTTSRGPADNLSSFIGQGDFDAILSSKVQTYLETTGPYGPISIDPGSVSGSITVRYEYVVPEPTTLAMLCLGGVVLLRRRS